MDYFRNPNYIHSRQFPIKHRRLGKSVRVLAEGTVITVDKDNFQSKECADRLKALSEPLRLRIVDVLRHGELTVGDIAELLEVELVTVSHHLKILKNAGLVEAQRDGRFIVYRLKSDLLQQASKNSKQFLNLGCCRIEVPNQEVPNQ